MPKPTPAATRAADTRHRERSRGRAAITRKLRRIDVPTLRAAWWALNAVRRTRKALTNTAFDQLSVEGPPKLPQGSGRGVHAVLRRLPNTCLERALVLQRWHAAHGVEKDVLIGVTSPDDFKAHAWLDGEPAPQEYHVLTRLRAK